MKKTKPINKPIATTASVVEQDTSNPSKKLTFRDFLILAGVILLGLLIYSNSFECTFHFDDLNNIINNPAIRDASNVAAIWKHSHNRFLPFYSFALNYQASGLEVATYHYVNLTIHLLSAVFVWLLTYLLCNTPNLRTTSLNKHRNSIAICAALLFVSHPLATQSVTYIVQRMASMAAMFYILSVLLYVKGRLTESAGKYVWFIGSLLAGIAALLSKENAYTLPFSLILCEIVFFQSNEFKISLRDYRVLGVLAGLAIIGTLVLNQFSSQFFRTLQPSGGTDYTVTTSNYLLTQFRVVSIYIRLLFFPYGQNLDWDIEPSYSLFEFKTLAGLLFLLGILAFAVWIYKKQRVIAFGIFWFFITLMVESSIMPIEDNMFEHRTYLPSFGFFFILAAGIFPWLASKNKYLAYGVLGGIILINSFLTFERNKVWANELTLWSDVVKKSPEKARGYLNRGVAQWTVEQWSPAIQDYRKAIELNPKHYSAAYWNLGTALNKFSNWEEAIGNFNKAIEIYPNYADAYVGRAIAYGSSNKPEEALRDINKAVEIAPGNAGNYFNRGVLFMNKKQFNEALQDFNKTIALDPNNVDAYINRSTIYANQKQYQAALEDCNKCITLNPKYLKAYGNRAILFTELKQFDKAIQDYSTLIQMNSGSIQAYLNRGVLYNQMNQTENAKQDFLMVLKLDPKNQYANSILSSMN